MDELIDFLYEFNIWQERTFPDQSATAKLHHLKLEISELVEEITCSAYIGPGNVMLRHELADCFLLLFATAGKCGFGAKDVISAMKEKFKIVEKQDFAAPDEKGIRHRVKTEPKLRLRK